MYTHTMEYNGTRSDDADVIADHNLGKRVRSSVFHVERPEVKHKGQISERDERYAKWI